MERQKSCSIKGVQTMEEKKIKVFARIGFILELDEKEAIELENKYNKFSFIPEELAVRFVKDGKLASDSLTSDEYISDAHYVPEWNN